MSQGIFKNIKSDGPASLIVFLVAVPLCLGIALASGAPALSGIIAGIIGGLIVGSLSNSPLGVSGPAAGLATIVLDNITALGSFEVLLVSIIIGGVIQLILGFLKGGIIGYYFPNSIIKGMLSAIGIVIFLKQVPHAFGYDKNPEGDLSFDQKDGENSFTEWYNIAEHLDYVEVGAVLIAGISLAILIFWEASFMKKNRIFQLIQGPLVVVVLGIVLNNIFSSWFPDIALSGKHLVSLPEKNLSSELTFPDFANALGNPKVYVIGGIIAIVASLETLLCLEATDKMDPDKRISDPNRELKAQGIGNILSGFIGGLPITQVIVRSSANIQSGGKSKLSAILHGAFILISLIAFPQILNMLPKASLAAILLVVGYKLAKPATFKAMYAKGLRQFVPFVVTIIAIVYTDLLIGIGIGLCIAVFIILYNNFRTPYFFRPENHVVGEPIILRLSEDVTFLNKAAMLKTLQAIPEGAEVLIDATQNVRIDDDVLEIIEDFEGACASRDILVKTKGFDNIRKEDAHKAYHKAVAENKFFNSKK
jgi:MFS superfamily sulfate permease-like transporter|tara:strand:- start:1063 stop:2670 length:1608 start_codon:yes stop_codon:yes gene_type:complete